MIKDLMLEIKIKISDTLIQFFMLLKAVSKI